MARPRKKGLEYFPHDTDAINDEKLEALTAVFGALGYAWYFVLLERIYRNDKFELDLSKIETIKVLQKKTFSDAETFQKLIRISLEVGLFDKKKYEKDKILTSRGIKARACLVVKKREKMRKMYKKRVSDAETPPETPPETPQSKVKYSKEKVYNKNKKLIDAITFLKQKNKGTNGKANKI